MLSDLERVEDAVREVIDGKPGAILISGDLGLELSRRLATTGRHIHTTTEDRRENWPELPANARAHYAMIRKKAGWMHRGETPDHVPNIVNIYSLDEFHDVKCMRDPLAAVIIRDGNHAISVLHEPWPALDFIECIGVETSDARVRSIVTTWADKAGLEVYDEHDQWIAFSRKP